MVATIAKLKLLLLKNSLKRSPWQIVGLVIGLLYGLFVAVLLVAGLIGARWLEVEQRGLILVLGGSVLVVLWWLIPLLTSTLDQTVDVSRFTVLPIRRRDLLLGTAVSGIIGIPGFFTVLVLLGTLITWSTGILSLIYALIGAVLVLLLTQFGARLLTTIASGLWSSRRGRELMSTFMILLVILVGPAIAVILEMLSELSDIDQVIARLGEIAAVAGWLPFGAPWAAAVDAANGDWLIGLLRFAIAIGTIIILALVWSKVLDRVLTNPPHEKVSERSGSGYLDSLAQGAVSATLVKTLRYWVRDNRLAISNLVIVLLPVAAVAVVIFARDIFFIDDELIASLGVIIAALYGWGTHNMLAYDGSAFWMQLSTGLTGWRDRLGRLIAEGGVGILFVLLSVFIGIILVGRYDLLLVVLGTSLAVLFVALGISSFLSTVWIYAVPAAGENPFNTPSGAGGLMMLAQMVSLAASFVASLPVLVLFFWAMFIPDAPGWLGIVTIIVAPIYGALLLWLGVFLGGKQLDRRGPEILLQIQKFS